MAWFRNIFGGITFAEFSEIYISRRHTQMAIGKLASTSFYPECRKIERELNPHFGKKHLSKITSFEVDQYLQSLLLPPKNLSPATANRYRACLHTIFEEAIYSEPQYCTINPVSKIRALSEKKKVGNVGLWQTKEERDAYIKMAFKHSRMHGVGAAILLLGGCRVGELLALQFGDIDWEKSFIRINKIIESRTGTVCLRTKGQRLGGEYRIILCPRLKKILAHWRLECRHPMDTDFILHQVNGQHLNYKPFNKVHYRVVSQARLPKIPLHGLRRTFGTLAAKAGFEKVEVQKMLGHESSKSTEAYVKPDLGGIADKVEELQFGEEIPPIAKKVSA